MLVRQPQIEFADLNVFEFDFDLTMAIFFLNADEQVYGRYCSRDEHGPDTRNSLAGLNYAMRAALDTHRNRPPPPTAPRPPAKTIRHYEGSRNRHGCIHCHQVKEIITHELKKAGKWNREMTWRYPLPDNLGLILEIDRGNVVERVQPKSAAERAGLQAGDVLQRVGDLPVYSIADVQTALDRAPLTGQLPILWNRGDDEQTAEIELADGWRKSTIAWRTSMLDMMPSAKLFGRDLSAAEKQSLGLTENRLAFEHREKVMPPAAAAGIQAGDIIIGVDGKELHDMTAYDFRLYIQRNYLVGERIQVDVLRQGKRLSLSMLLGS